MTTIDQQARRRTAWTGLTPLDETLACPGYVLYYLPEDIPAQVGA